MKIIRNSHFCYSCKACQLACSFHHTHSFWPEKSSINVSRNPMNGKIKWFINSTCDQCKEEEDLMEHYAVIGRSLEKAFNSLHTDMSREDDIPPRRFMEEEVKSGPSKGFKIDKNKYNKMLDEFYELWEWDVQTGMQTRSGLEKFGLKELAEKLAKQDKLVEK